MNSAADELLMAEVRALAERHLAARKAEDPAAAAELFAADGTYYDEGHAELLRGRAAVREYLERRARRWRSETRVVGPFVTTDGFAYIWDATIVPRAEGIAGDATGLGGTIKGTAAVTVRDGKIVEHVDSWNPIDLLVALGEDDLPPLGPRAVVDYVSVRATMTCVEPEIAEVQSTRATLDRYARVIRESNVTNDFAGLSAVFAPDLWEEELGLHHETHTLPGQLALWNEVRAFWPHDVHIEWMMHCAGGYVITCRCDGTMQHDFAGLPGNLRPYSVRYLSVGVIIDDLIVRVRDPFNAAKLLREVGFTTIPATWKTMEPLNSHTPIDPELH